MVELYDILAALGDLASDVFAASARGVEHVIRGLFGTTERISFLYLLVSAAIALVVLGVRRRRQGKRDLGGLLRALVPREVYLHRSSLQDYLWFFLSPALWFSLPTAYVLVLPFISVGFRDALVSVFGSAPHWHPGVAAQFACAFLIFLAIDLGNYVSHWLMHHVGFLWDFHKTHHSAEVLNPLTADRLHPLERLQIEVCVAVTLGFTLGALRYLYEPNLSITRIAGINAFAFITNVISGNLRHSHVWVSYGTVMEHIFSSPAQHQIHHSRSPEHLDKNLATNFALWDWLFGTLYVPSAKPQVLQFGLADGTERAYRNPWALFALPFQGNWARLRGALTRLAR